MPQETSAAEARRRRFTKIRAILAGGLVLGIGAAVTLATWNDSESATGQFSTSTFGIVGSTDGLAFTDHPADDPAALTFSLAPDTLSPGVTTYALFAVKTTDSTSVDGTITVTDPTFSPTNELSAALTTAVRVVADATCDEDAFTGGSEVPQGGEPITAAGADTAYFCLQVALPDDATTDAQGQTTTASWTFTGESNS